VKLGLVGSLVGYHLVCGAIRKQVVARRTRWTSHGLRLWNEVVTVRFVATTLVASLKNGALTWTVALSTAGVVGALTAGVCLYRRVRPGT
jgi:putative membrane protein